MITEYSLAMAALWGTVFLAAGAALTKSKRFIQWFGVSGFLAVMLSGTIRILVPVEFPYTPIFRDTVLFPFLLPLLRGEVFSLLSIRITYQHLILFAWGMGVCAYLAMLTGSIIRQRTQISRMHFTQSEQYDRILQELHGGERCQVLVSEEVASPLLVGLFRPRILMPDIVMNDVQAQFVLQHELQHERNRDLWKKLFCSVFCAFFWWNPLAYLIQNKLNYILELNCDYRVVGAQGEEDRIAYAEATLSVLKQVKRTEKPPLCAVAFAGETSTGQLAKRCELILYPPRASRLKPLLFSILVGLLLLSYTFVVQPYAPPPPDDYIEVTAENAYLQGNTDGTYTLMVDGEDWGEVLPKDFDTAPYNELLVKGN